MVEFLKTITLLMLVFNFYFFLYKISYYFLFLKTKNKKQNVYPNGHQLFFISNSIPKFPKLQRTVKSILYLISRKKHKRKLQFYSLLYLVQNKILNDVEQNGRTFNDVERSDQAIKYFFLYNFVNWVRAYIEDHTCAYD